MIKDSHKKTIITCALPSPGHAIPMIRLANALSKAGHKVFYFSSSYDIPKYQDKYVNI
jgi:UDP:flavonoid glycosyltransferase YjiC (YdhE family)